MFMTWFWDYVKVVKTLTHVMEVVCQLSLSRCSGTTVP